MLQSSEGFIGSRPTPHVGYSVTILGGILFASFIDMFYRGGGAPGKLVFYAYELFLGPYRNLWIMPKVGLLLPFLLVNIATYQLYRKSSFRSEQIFFQFLSVILNGLVFFAAINVLYLTI